MRAKASEIPPVLTDARLLSTFQLAALLGFSPLHVRRLASSGAIPAPMLIGGRALRWRASDIAAFIDARARTPSRVTQK